MKKADAAGSIQVLRSALEGDFDERLIKGPSDGRREGFARICKVKASANPGKGFGLGGRRSKAGDGFDQWNPGVRRCLGHRQCITQKSDAVFKPEITARVRCHVVGREQHHRECRPLALHEVGEDADHACSQLRLMEEDEGRKMDYYNGLECMLRPVNDRIRGWIIENMLV